MGWWGGFGGGVQMLGFEGKLNNFKVHSAKHPKTYFNTSLRSPSLGAPRLYVCLRQCERVRVCVTLRRISILRRFRRERERRSGIERHCGAPGEKGKTNKRQGEKGGEWKCYCE